MADFENKNMFEGEPPPKSKKLKKAEKKYVKMRKLYTEKSAGRYDVRYITENDFKFQAVLPGETVIE